MRYIKTDRFNVKPIKDFKLTPLYNPADEARREKALRRWRAWVRVLYVATLAAAMLWFRYLWAH